MAIKIGIVNQKGGVGKTTTAICLTDAFTQIGYKTLLVDFDPQANSTSVFRAENQEKTVYDSLLKGVPLKDVIVRGNSMGDIAPSSEDLENAITELVQCRARENKLKNALSTAEDEYDIIIIDSNPAAGPMMDNVLAAANGVVIPIEAEEFSVQGVLKMVKKVYDISDDINKDLKIYGILLTNVNLEGSSEHRKNEAQFKEIPDDVAHTFKTEIRHSEAIPSSQGWMNAPEVPMNAKQRAQKTSQGSIFKYGLANNASKDYTNLAKELMEVIANE